ncbi:MAG: hypothetical protein Q8R28_07650, partial [Dehalococcoidia bacterium]|nr:hypothetical protein [Dehalococcoidia bacterium]
LKLDELVNGGLSLSTPSITLRFTSNGSAVTISNVEEVVLSALDPGFEPRDLTSNFTVTQGAVQATKASDITSILSGIRSDARLKVTATDELGFTYDDELTFSPGLFQVDGQLQAPPSQPSLTVGGMTVKVQFGNGIQKTLTTDSTGKFQVSQVPGGMASIESKTDSGGSTYSGRADIAVSRNTNVVIRMLGLADVLAGVAPWQVTSSASALSSNVPESDPARVQSQTVNAESPYRSDFIGGVSAQATAVVSVSGGGENVPVSDRATLTVAKGTKKVTLQYEVWTAEYPTYVLKQSRYNDYWALQVLSSSGGQLFSIYRFVNQQLYSPPTWDATGSTGEIQVDIDVSSVTANGDAQLTLNATSQNTGDSALATSVAATLGANAGITIGNITMDAVNPTKGNSSRYSIPRSGQTNVYQRHFDIGFTKPDGAQITKVKAELLDANGSALQTVVDAAVGSSQVQLLNDTTVRVQVTFSNIGSAVASTPPSTDQIRYRFTLKGRNSDGTESESKPKESATYFALWRMPDGFTRYGVRDQGLDDWVAKRTYTWLENHRTLITRIDDISGEHARDIGHSTHAQGTDIDMFHVYTFPNGARSGADNYLRLRENVMAALAGDNQALSLVDAWASATRTRLDSLIADSDVSSIYYAIGSSAQVQGQPRLTAGWAKALLTTGKYTNPDGKTVTLASGAWANTSSKMHYNATHNSHIHIALR